MVVPSRLREGVLYEAACFFCSSSNWRSAHEDLGIVVFGEPRGSLREPSFLDLEDDTVWRDLAALAARGVIREWHFEVPSLSFSTRAHPRLRSRSFPLGFSPQDPVTLQHTKCARRLSLIANIIASSGSYFSIVQPRSSVMFQLHSFRVLCLRGAVLTRLRYAEFGSPFRGSTVWLHNKPWVEALGTLHQVSSEPAPLQVSGSVSPGLLAELEVRCQPSVSAVLGRTVQCGESVAKLAAVPPTFLCQRVAAGSLHELRVGSAPMPESARLRSVREGWPGIPEVVPPARDAQFEERPFYDDPEWIGELSDSLPFREIFRYKFARAGHINVQETRVYKTWLKYLCARHPRSRSLGLIDSRVLLGASSKGRSSSGALGRVLRSSLPYVLGGALYPAGLHVYSSKNRADGPSRGRQLEGPARLYLCGSLSCFLVTTADSTSALRLPECQGMQRDGSGSCFC